MDSASYSCLIQFSEHCLIEKYIRVVGLHRGMVKHCLDGTEVYRSQHQVLILVSDNLNTSQKELARMYGVSGATITVFLEKLEKGGRIRRLVDQGDNRRSQICITGKGREMVEDSAKIFRRTECRMFEGFSEDGVKMSRKLLDQIYENLNQGLTDKMQGEKS